MSDDAANGTDAGARGASKHWIALAILTGIYACHSLDRAVVSVVIEPLKNELGLSDSQVGLITGLGYGVAFAMAGLPVGALADRVNRVRLMAILSILWSGMTALAGLGNTFTTLLLARMGVGAAEAGGQPTALSLLSDKFAEERRATALGVFYFGASVGYAISFFCGGAIAQTYGWRATFFLAGIPGVMLALVLLALVREPVRSGEEVRSESPALGVTLSTIFGQSALRHLFAAMVLAGFSVTVVLMWMVPLMMREHDMSLPSAGLAAGITMGVAQALGAVLAGYLADRLARGGRHRITYVPAAALALTVPFALGFELAPDPAMAIVCLVLFGLFPSTWTAPGYTAILGLVGPRMRGRSMALVQLLTTLLGASLAPTIVGLLSDRIGGPHSLAIAMALLAPAGFWSAAHFVFAGRAMKRAAAASP